MYTPHPGELARLAECLGVPADPEPVRESLGGVLVAKGPGTRVIDGSGEALLTDWITQLDTCP